MKLSRSLTLATAAASAVVLAFAPSAQAATTLNVGGASSVKTVVNACIPSLPSNVSFAYHSQSSGTGQSNMETGKYDFAFQIQHTQHHNQVQRSTLLKSTFHHMYGQSEFSTTCSTTKQVAISAVNVAKIFAGKITMWNDPALVADNSRTITVVNYREDAKGNIVKDARGNPQVLLNKDHQPEGLNASTANYGYLSL
jgi:phosphate transport system substrate-binding protein